MHKRAFWSLNRTFIHVSGLPLPYFDDKLIYKVSSFIIKIWWGKPETSMNVRFRPLNARLCMFQVLPHHILIIKLNTL